MCIRDRAGSGGDPQGDAQGDPEGGLARRETARRVVRADDLDEAVICLLYTSRCV